MCLTVLVSLICRPDMLWTQPGEKKLTGGTHWQSKTMSTTTAWNATPMAPAPVAVPQMVSLSQGGCEGEGGLEDHQTPDSFTASCMHAF